MLHILQTSTKPGQGSMRTGDQTHLILISVGTRYGHDCLQRICAYEERLENEDIKISCESLPSGCLSPGVRKVRGEGIVNGCIWHRPLTLPALSVGGTSLTDSLGGDSRAVVFVQSRTCRRSCPFGVFVCLCVDLQAILFTRRSVAGHDVQAGREKRYGVDEGLTITKSFNACLAEIERKMKGPCNQRGILPNLPMIWARKRMYDECCIEPARNWAQVLVQRTCDSENGDTEPLAIQQSVGGGWGAVAVKAKSELGSSCTLAACYLSALEEQTSGNGEGGRGLIVSTVEICIAQQPPREFQTEMLDGQNYPLRYELEGKLAELHGQQESCDVAATALLSGQINTGYVFCSAA
ncbi:hypothetical protein BaRGS_00007046, partial [Batillaria attramentaria]